MMQRILGVMLLTLTLAGCSEPPYNNISNDELKLLLAEGVPIYDIRRPEEWRQTGVVEGSQRLTFVDVNGRLLADFLPRFTAAVGKNDQVILICRTGSRTAALAKYLAEDLGYTRIYNVQDGITRWMHGQNPVTRN